MNILTLPHPLLREKSKKTGKVDAELLDFIEQLKVTMCSEKGCVGIAAPQVGVLKRVVIVDVTGHKKAKKQSGLLILINPVIEEKSGKSVNREGCLSVPDFTGNVERAKRIKVRYTGTDGRGKELLTAGFEAVAIQHEMDHLDGILFIDRIRNSKRDLFKRVKY